MGRTARGYKQILKRDPCVYCGTVSDPDAEKERERGTIDHIHPRIQGGADHWMNYAGSCYTCNGRKSDKSLLGFMLGEDIPSNREGLQDYPVESQIVIDGVYWYNPLQLPWRYQ